MILRKVTKALTLALLMAALAVPAGATLLTIGTASYGGNNYNLIYDNDSPFGSIVWSATATTLIPGPARYPGPAA